MRTRGNLLIGILIMAEVVACSPKNKNDKQIEKYDWFTFQWYGDSVSGHYYDKLAIFLPLKINGIMVNFTAQFDLGANNSLLYGNSLKNYFGSRQQLLNRLDTVNKSSDETAVYYPVKTLNVTSGKVSLNDILFMDNYGEEIHKDSLYTRSDKHIGTIGATFVKDKVLIIDYPNKRMCLLDSIDSYWTSIATFVDCKVKKNRIHIPLTINGKIYWILFDTGASIFPLTTNYATWSSLVDPTAKVDTLPVSSWGETVPFYGAIIKDDVYVGTLKLNQGKVWYSTNKRLLDFNDEENITGTTGNIYFLENVVVLDFRNKKFGILNRHAN